MSFLSSPSTQACVDRAHYYSEMTRSCKPCTFAFGGLLSDRRLGFAFLLVVLLLAALLYYAARVHRAATAAVARSSKYWLSYRERSSFARTRVGASVSSFPPRASSAARGSISMAIKLRTIAKESYAMLLRSQPGCKFRLLVSFLQVLPSIGFEDCVHTSDHI
jgi:hypothetical protein